MAAERLTFHVEATDIGKRLDVFLAEQIQNTSRARVQELLENGKVALDSGRAKAAYRLRGGESVTVEWAPPRPLRAFPEDIPLEILYEDEDLIAVNKPAGIAVHAGAGRQEGTLVNALLHRFGQLSNVGGELRPGIVHRLDRQTSGVVIVAKHDEAHRKLAAQFQKRAVQKTYTALVQGSLKQEHGRIASPIARDLVRRHRMTGRRKAGREALTEYRVVQRFPGCTLLEVDIHTGRTHQIRVHLSEAGHPVVGDTMYGAKGGVLARNFLHARRIRLTHPRTGAPLEIAVPLPEDLAGYLATLRQL